MGEDFLLLRSRTLRAVLGERTEALNQVKPLRATQLTTGEVAGYFEVPVRAVQLVVAEHREELVDCGYRVLRGERLTAFKAVSGVQSRARSLALFNRETVLLVAMLLRGSEPARRVRGLLLDRIRPLSGAVAVPWLLGAEAAAGPCAEAGTVRLAENAVRRVLAGGVQPLLFGISEQVGRNGRALAALAERVGAIESTLTGR